MESNHIRRQLDFEVAPMTPHKRPRHNLGLRNTEPRKQSIDLCFNRRSDRLDLLVV